LLGFALALGGAPALAADGSPAIPACDDAGVLSTIVERQAWAEANSWHDGVLIDAVDQARQWQRGTRFLSDIEHRHCIATAHLAGGHGRKLFYVISKDTGFAGWGWNVDFCLAGHDPAHLYGEGCRVLW